MEISNKRCIQILKLLLKNKECMTGDNLAVAIGVSSRTIRNDMKDLNRALEDHGASVVSEIGQGYYLKIEDQEKFLAFQNEMEEQKREKDFKTLSIFRKSFFKVEVLMKSSSSRSKNSIFSFLPLSIDSNNFEIIYFTLSSGSDGIIFLKSFSLFCSSISF